MNPDQREFCVFPAFWQGRWVTRFVRITPITATRVWYYQLTHDLKRLRKL